MAKKPVDLTEVYVSKMRACKPKKGDHGTFEFEDSENEILADIKYVLTTGITAFDEIVGGFPFGRMTEIFGLESCGKTAMVVRSAIRAQCKHIYEVVARDGSIYKLKRLEPKKMEIMVAYIDNEHSLEKGFKIAIDNIEFDKDGNEIVEKISMRAAVGRCDTIDMVFKAVDKLIEVIHEREEQLEEDKEDKLVFGVMIVDTIAGTSSKEEMTKDWGEDDYPRQAKQISEGFRILKNDISRHNIAAIFTNQVRTAMTPVMVGRKIRYGTPQEKDFSTFGGKALGFYASHRVFMFSMPTKYTLVKGSKFAAGCLIGFRTTKNRLRKPNREGRMALIYDDEKGGLHDIFSKLETLLFLDLAEFHDNGEISFKFKSNGVTTSTFEQHVSLEEQDDRSSKKKKDKNPRIEGRYEWPSFYRAHRSDFDLLWQAAIKKVNTIEGLDGFYPTTANEDNGEDDDEEDELPARSRRRSRPVTEETAL